LGLKVFCFGEALVDMLAGTGQYQDTFTRYPGGAPANVAAAIARLGGDSFFIGKLGQDHFGDFLQQALQNMGVHTDYVSRTAHAKTGLAFVTLDAHGERSFEFYRSPSADMLFNEADFTAIDFQPAAIFHFGSNTLTTDALRSVTQFGAEQARATGHLISFDVNLRLNLWPQTAQADAQQHILPFIWQSCLQAHLLKVSAEEWQFLCQPFLAQQQDPHDCEQQLFAAGVKLLLITDANQPVQMITPHARYSLTPPPVQTRDATAAGDAFVGGFLFQLAQSPSRQELQQKLQQPETLQTILRFAAGCGAYAVTQYGAFSALPDLTQVL
jgi:fructokinase